MGAASDFRSYAMPYIGIGNVNLIGTQASARMMQDLNKALTELFANEQREKLSLQVRGPTSVTIDQVTNGSTAITFTGMQSWMVGCTIVITGDALQNQLEKRVSASVALNAPYQGATQSNVSAVVYQDVLNLTTEAKAIYPPALLNNQYFVEPLNSRAALENQRTVWRDEYNAVPKISRRPQWSILEDNLQFEQTPTSRIVFDSLPDTSYVWSAEAELAAPRVTSWSDARDFFMPGREDELILFPVALAHFASWPNFVADSQTRQMVLSQANDARARWSGRTKGFTHTAVDVESW